MTIEKMNERLLQTAREYKRGLLTDQDYLDRIIETVLTWVVTEGRDG